MSSEKSKIQEKFVFEFYDETLNELFLKDVEIAEEVYNEVDFENDLNEEQLEIINNLRGPMLVIAGAGSGKTRTIVYSVAKLLLSGIKPNEIMLVTFTNKAANEMIKRVERLLGKKPKGIWAGTFHALANRFLRIYAKTLGLKPNYTIIDETDAKGLMKLAISESDLEGINERFPSAAIAKNILSFSINCNKSIEEIIQWKYPQFDNEKLIKKLKEIFKRYAKKKEESSLVDFDDLLVFWNMLLDERNVARAVAKKIKYILVDEYQANYENILNFEKKYENCKRYTITYNYRSVSDILELANDSIRHNKKQFKKKMRPTRSGGVKPFFVEVSDDEEQARFISNQVLKLRDDGFELNEIAILVRAGHHTFKIELELQAKNIPYEVRAGVTFFERAHIKDVVSHLRIIENPYDEISWNRIFNMIPGIGSKSATKIFKIISETENPINFLIDQEALREKLKGLKIPRKGLENLRKHVVQLIGITSMDSPSEVILKILELLEDYIKSKYENWQDRVMDIRQLVNYAQNFNSIRQFLENLSLNKSDIESKSVIVGSQGEEEKPLVISTIHRAKGLEWRVVFIPMLCEEQFPSIKSIGDLESIEEERRVFYVALTRAKDQLYLISPSIIQKYGGWETSRPSPFILELNPKTYTRSTVKFKEQKENEKNKARSLFSNALDFYGKKQ
ncbi:MAG: ATP-dependent helicase [Promethearchaeota archaeon]